MVDADLRLRVASGLLMSPQPDGRVVVWRSHRPEPCVLEAEILSLLLQFGDGRTRGEAAAAAQLEDDATVAEVVETFVGEGLLVRKTGGRAMASIQVASARIAEVVDPGTFVADTTEPVVTGVGTVGGRRVAFVAWEPLTKAGVEEVLQLQERVQRDPCPIVYLFDLFSIGRDPEVEFAGPRGVGRIYANMGRLAGVVPQIGVVFGTLFRPAAFPPGMCDVVIFLDQGAFVHIGDPSVVKEYTGATVTADELGGAAMHADVSGLADRVVATSAEAALLVRQVLGILPTSSTSAPPMAPPIPAMPAPLDKLIGDEIERPLDMHAVLGAIVDAGSLVELRPRWTGELITALARLEGVPVGIVANESKRRGGVLTVDACDKAARFIAQCDAFGLPIVFCADVPGFAIGRDAERAGIVRAAGRLFTAIARATVPRIAFVVRRAHTAGLYAMCGPGFDPDAFLALPSASIAIFGERAQVPAGLERGLDREGRQAVKHFLKTQRPPPPPDAQVVTHDRARAELAAHVRRLFGTRRR